VGSSGPLRADADDRAAALLHDVVEDKDVTDEDLWAGGFADRTLLMTKRPPEADDVYYARLRAYEPARRLKLDADVASNSDPGRLALVSEPKRSRLTVKYAKAARALAPAMQVAPGTALASGPQHEVNTLAEDRPDGDLAWFAECSCGWRGPDRTDEYTADFDRLAHSNDNPPQD